MIPQSSPRSPLEELSELIAMAEKSAADIDALAESITQAKISIIAITVATTVVTMICVIFMLNAAIGRFQHYGYDQLIQIGAAGLLALTISAGTYAAYTRLLRMRRLMRDLRLERDITDRLVSLIEPQFSWVRRVETVSPVAIATLEIRIRRLSREHSREFA